MLKSKDEQVGCDMTHSPVAQNKTKTVITLHHDHVDTIKRVMFRAQRTALEDKMGKVRATLMEAAQRRVGHSFLLGVPIIT